MFFSLFFKHHGDLCRLKVQLSDVLWWLHLQHGTFDGASSLDFGKWIFELAS